MSIAKKINPKFKGYGYLEAVLDAALHQAAAGKGKERHACDRPFEAQPMQTISDLLQTTDGMAYQAIKKIQESTRMTPDAAIRELLGSINYTAGIIVKMLRDREASDAFEKTLADRASLEGTTGSSVLKPSRSLLDDAMVYMTNEDLHKRLNPNPSDVVPLKTYNDLLNRFEEMQKRVCEAD